MFHGPMGARARRPQGPSAGIGPGPTSGQPTGATAAPPTGGSAQPRSLTQAMYFNGSDPLDALEGLPVASLASGVPGRPRRMSRARAILGAIGAVVFIGFMMTVQELVFGDGGLGGAAGGGGGSGGGGRGGNGGVLAAQRAAATAGGSFHAPLTLRMSYGEEEDPLGVWVLAQSALAHLTGTVMGSGAGDSGEGLVPVAGLPRFPRLFARDALVSVLLMESVEAPLDLLRTLGQLQGTGPDPATGMELGKVPHEWPGVQRPNGLWTTYSACDTTPLFIIATYTVKTRAGARARSRRASVSDLTALAMVDALMPSIQRAVGYILSHVDSRGLFVDSPALAGGATQFALFSTYWKDSGVFGFDGKRREVVYPLAMLLPHVQALCALRCAGDLLGNATFTAIASDMVQAMHKHLRGASVRAEGAAPVREFLVGLDGAGPIAGSSSDALHALFYLSPGDVSVDDAVGMQQAATALETRFGYLTAVGPGPGQGSPSDEYHIDTVWPFEQAVIHAGASRHGLPHAQAVSARIIGALVRTLKVTAKNVVADSVPFAGAEAMDGGRPRLALPSGDDGWPKYFFPELLRFSRSGDLSSRHVDPRSPSVWSGRVAGVGAAGHILFREGSGAASFGTAGCTLQLWTVAACVYFGDAVMSTDTPRNLRGDAAAASIPAPEPLPWPVRPPTPKAVGGSAACDATTGLPLGVSLRDAEARGLAVQYSTCCSGSDPQFVCDGGATQLPCTRLGDDYCDCADGSDEPRTAACTTGRFFCNQGLAEFPSDYASHTPRRSRTSALIPSALVGDGVCDCCGGEDEGGACNEAPSCGTLLQ